MDLGLQMLHATDVGDAPLDFGCSIANLGTAMKLGGQSSPLPLHLRAGVLWHALPFLSGAFDSNFPVDDDPYVGAGVEARAGLGSEGRWKASARLGYNQRFHRGVDGFAGMAAGAGLDLGMMALDYAWVPFGELGQTQRLSLDVRF